MGATSARLGAISGTSLSRITGVTSARLGAISGTALSWGSPALVWVRFRAQLYGALDRALWAHPAVLGLAALPHPARCRSVPTCAGTSQGCGCSALPWPAPTASTSKRSWITFMTFSTSVVTFRHYLVEGGWAGETRRNQASLRCLLPKRRHRPTGEELRRRRAQRQGLRRARERQRHTRRVPRTQRRHVETPTPLALRPGCWNHI
jgi:hypothetical protein